MSQLHEDFLTRLELSKYIVADMSNAEKLNMLDKYEKLADSIINKSHGSVFNNDAENYCAILNDQVFTTFMKGIRIADLTNYPNLYKVYQVCSNTARKTMNPQNANSDTAVKNKAFNLVRREMCGKIAETGMQVSNVMLDTNSVQVALQTFGLKKTATVQDVVTPEEVAHTANTGIEFDDDLENEYNRYINGTDDAYEEDEHGEDPVDYSNVKQQAESELKEIFDTKKEEDTDKVSDKTQDKKDESARNLKDIPIDDDAPLEEKSELYKKLEKELGSYLSGHVNTLCNVLSALYSSGFTRAQAGILISRDEARSPLVAIRKIDNANDIEYLRNSGVDVGESDLERGYKTVSLVDNGTFQDRMIYEAITSCIPQLENYADNPITGGSIPEISTLLNTKAVCYKLHLQFQSANIDYCTKENSEIKIKDWVKETQLKKNNVSTFTEWRQKINGNKRRLKSYKSMVRPWYEWSIKKILIESLIAAGVTDSSDMNKIMTTVNKVTANLRNVVVMSVRSPGAEYEIKISSDITSAEQREEMRDAIIAKLTNQLNLAGSNDIQVVQIAKESFNSLGVLTLSVILDQKKANSDTIFAGDIVNELKNEERPSWEHALLGMSEDRQWIYWDDFMNPAKAGPVNRVYTIYAGSRAGKGNMTSALLANALCDSKRIYYTDGKPETGACLGEIPWLTGQDAYIFDGKATGQAPFVGDMEDWTNNLRQKSDKVAYITKLPEELFSNTKYFTTDTQEEFLGVMRYLKSLALCAAIISARSKNELPVDNWDIWIFDEMTNMAKLEAKVREIFLKYLGEKGVKGLKSAKNHEEKTVLTGIDVSKIESEVRDPSSDKYDAGVDYILKWLEWTNNIVTTMGEAVTISLGKANTNLIFIFQNASWLKADQSVTTLGRVVMMLPSTKIVGRDAIAKECGAYGDGTTLTKEWYTNKVNKGTGWWAISKASDIRNGNVEVFKPFSVWTVPIGEGEVRTTAPGECMDPKYMYGYLLTLCNTFGVDAASVLHSSYEYAEAAVKQFSFAQSLMEYMYDSSNLSSGEVSADYQDLINKKNGDGDGEDTPQPAVRKSVSLSDDSTSGNNDEAEEPINFGIDDNSQGAPSPIPGKQVNSPGPSKAPTQHQDAFEQAKVETQQMKSIKGLMPTQKLRASNFGDRVLEYYYNTILNRNNILENNMFNYTLRDRKTNTLFGAAITLSNLCYMAMERGVYSIDTLRSKAMEQITSLNDRQDKWKFMLGMIEDYCTNVLPYDEMPSQDRLREYQSKYGANINLDSGYAYNENSGQSAPDGTQGGWDNTYYEEQTGQSDASDSWNEGSFDNQNTNNTQSRLQEQIDMLKSFDMDIGDGRSSFQINNKTGSTTINPSPEDDAVRLSLDDYIEEKSQKWRTFERFKRTLFETSNGTAYEFKSRWDFILKRIGERYPDKAMVRNLAFTELQVVVNSKVVVLNDLIGGDAEITVVDLLRIRDTFKKFPFIQSVTFDKATTQCLIDEYGTSAQELWNIFRENRALKVIQMDTPTEGQMQIRREAIQTMVNQIDKAMGARVAQMQYEQYGSSFNPRLENKSPGYTDRMQKNKKSKASSWFQNMPINKKMSPKVKKRLKWGGATLGVLALGAVIGVPGLIATGVGSAIGFFRGRN